MSDVASATYRAVEQAQDVLAEYIVPDSGISDTECVNRLLGILDHQDLVRAMRASPASPSPATGVRVNEDVQRGIDWLRGKLGSVDPQELLRSADAIEGIARADSVALAEALDERDALRDAARDMISSRTDTYRAGNGRQVGIQDDSGEKCWIVRFDEMAALEAALGDEQSLADEHCQSCGSLLWGGSCPICNDPDEVPDSEVSRLRAIIDNARQAFAETHTDDEARCRAMAAHLHEVDAI